jgi:hypothetical protein
MDQPDELRSIARVNLEAQAPPVFSPEHRARIQFFIAVLGGLAALIGAIITATAVLVNARTDIAQNKADIATVKGETKTVDARVDATNVKLQAVKEMVDENKRQLDIRKEPFEQLLKKMAVLDTYDFKKWTELTDSMASQREYGISNKEWYLGKHGYPPPSNPAANKGPSN